MKQITAEGLHDAYKKCLDLIYHRPEYISKPRGQKINEVLGLTVEILDPTINLFTNKVRGIDRKYLSQEIALYYAGENGLFNKNKSGLGFGKASKFWEKIANKDNTVNSAYGHLLFVEQEGERQSQWEWLLQSFKDDIDTRQAIAHINRPFHQYRENKDFVCTMSYHFFVRYGKLHLHVHRRSQDLFFGLTYDAPWEMFLMQSMLRELQHIYPNIDLKLGTYTLFIGSAHIYERNFDIISKMLKHKFEPERVNIGNFLPMNIEVQELVRKGTVKIPQLDFTKWLLDNI